MAGNKSSFVTKVVSSKSFRFILDSFDYAVTFLFNIKQKAKLAFISSALIKTSSTITLKKIKMVVANSRALLKPIQSISLKKIKLGFTVREIGKVVLPINIKKIKLGFTGKANQKASSSIVIKKIKIGFVGSYGTFYTLGAYDPQTLGTLDTKTLGEMDFTAI